MSEPSERVTRPSLDYDIQKFPGVDERRAAWQREFAQTTGAFSLAFQHAAIGMAIVDLDGKFLKLNHAFCKIVGYGEEDLLALDFQSITHPGDLDADVALARHGSRGVSRLASQFQRHRSHRAVHARNIGGTARAESLTRVQACTKWRKRSS